MDEAFRSEMAAGYTLAEPVIVLGSPLLGDEVLTDVRVQVALSRVNRHGLIAGATGTGKTKTLQIFAGQLSAAGVPVFAVDVKGDLSGIGAPGDATDQRTIDRCTSLGWTFEPAGHPLEILSLSGKTGAHVRASVSSFGPLLLGKVLDLNETQTSILSLVFRYCDDQDLPLLDLADLRTTLKFLGSDEGKPVLEDLGGISPASLGVILRAIVTIEQEGADVFFGEPEFDVDDLLRTTADGKGIVTLLEVADVMDKPRLYSTFVLWMLAQLYEGLPEVGDLPKPKLAFFFDEAHLLFDDASEPLLEQIERTARLIRSKGVGVYFVTQAPTDVPSSVLSQLGNRVQHALRAFTPDDADALRKTARTFPVTDHYDVERTITSLGIGEALVTVLSPKGVPTPLAATRLVPPDSRMAPLAEAEIAQVVAASPLATRYGETVDRESAHEIITGRLANARAAAATAAGEATMRDQVSPTTNAGLGTMTPAQQKREIERQARELRKAQEAAQRERKAKAREAAAAARQREKTIETGIRTAGKVVSSRAGQSLLRGVFDTIFGTGRSR
jgi:DNA helicase HerA-like ATPase